MSAPSYAIIKDKSGQVLGNVFVNVGWVFTTRGFVECLNKVSESDVYKANEAHTIDIYGKTYPKEFMEDLKHFNRDEQEYIMECLYLNPC